MERYRQMSLEEEFNSWEVLSDKSLEDFEESLQLGNKFDIKINEK